MKKTLSILLACVMTLSAVPVFALGSEEGGGEVSENLRVEEWEEEAHGPLQTLPEEDIAALPTSAETEVDPTLAEWMEYRKTDRYILKLGENDSIEDLALTLGYQVVEKVPLSAYETYFPGYFVITLDQKVSPDVFCTFVSDSVDFVQPDYEMELCSELAEGPMAMDMSAFLPVPAAVVAPEYNLKAAHRLNTGAGAVIAIIDSGIDQTHPELAGSFVDGWNFLDHTSQVTAHGSAPVQAHGTHIAGIIHQVAPNARMMPLQVFDVGKAYTSTIVTAIEYAEVHGAQIVNCSWGSTEENPVLQKIMNDSSMVFITAAGNDRKDLMEEPFYPACFAGENIVSVACVNGDGGMSYFSNYGENVDLAAWGRDVTSTVPGGGYGKMMGTSVSAAFVSGTAALVLGSGTEQHEIKAMLKASADHSDALERETDSGNILNYYNAVGHTYSVNALSDIPANDFDVYNTQQVDIANENLEEGQVIKISAGPWHTLALKNDGTVWAWGSNGNGQLGINSTTSKEKPMPVIGLTDVVDIAAGSVFSMALKRDGTVWAWGRNTYGELGTGVAGYRKEIPVQVSNITNAVAIAAGDAHGLALLEDGTVCAWGKNEYGELGKGRTDWTKNPENYLPEVIQGLTDIAKISAYGRYNLALTDGGETVYEWGLSAHHYYAGDGASYNYFEIPFAINFYPDSRDTIVGKVIDISAGEHDSTCLLETGEILVWGNGCVGADWWQSKIKDQAGTVQIPLENITAISKDLALDCNGNVYCFDRNTVEQNPYLSEISFIATNEQRENSTNDENRNSFGVGTDGRVWNWSVKEITSQTWQQTEPTEIEVRCQLLMGARAADPIYVLRSESGESLSLPNKVTVLLEDLKTDNWYVQWDLSDYEERKMTGASVILQGDISCNYGTINPENIKAEIEIFLLDAPLNILSVAPSQITIEPNTDEEDLPLPGYVIATLENGRKETVDVVWDMTSYVSTESEQPQTFPGELAPAEYIQNTSALTGTLEVVVRPGRITDIWTAWDSIEVYKDNGMIWTLGIKNKPIEGLSDVDEFLGFNIGALKKDGTVCSIIRKYASPQCSFMTEQKKGLVGVTSISSSGDHCIVLKDDHTLWAWGSNSYGELGTMDRYASAIPLQIFAHGEQEQFSAENVVEVIARPGFSAVVMQNGSIYAWGKIDENTQTLAPIEIDQLPDEQGEISSGGRRICAPFVEMEDGTLWYQSQFSDEMSPTIAMPDDIVYISQDGLITGQEGSVWVWGEKPYGISRSNTYLFPTDIPMPVLKEDGTKPLKNIQNFYRISEGYIALAKTGDVYVWGANKSGLLGVGTNRPVYRSVKISNSLKLSPMAISSLESEFAVSAAYGTAVENLPLPKEVTATLVGGAQVILPVQWGASNEYDPHLVGVPQSLIGTVECQDVTVETAGHFAVASVVLEEPHRIAAIESRTLKVEAHTAASGLPLPAKAKVSLEDGSTRYLPVTWNTSSYDSLLEGPQELTGELDLAPDVMNPDDMQPVLRLEPSSLGFIQISIPLNQGYYYGASSVYMWALREDGTAWYWGGESNNTNILPVKVPGLSDIIAVESGNGGGYALERDGSVWEVAGKKQPQKLPGLSDVVAISAGLRHCLALKADGTVWSWGSNSDGQLGARMVDASSEPVQVKDLNGIQPLTGIVQIAAGPDYSIAAKADGTIISWGCKGYSREHYTHNGNRYLPGVCQEAAPRGYKILDLKYMSAGTYGMIALKTDGSAYVWGRVTENSIEDLALEQIAELRLVGVAGGSNGENVMVLSEDGTAWACGRQSYGAVGNGLLNSEASELVQVKNESGDGILTDVIAIEAGGENCAAITADGTVWVWGRNNYGQLCDGTKVNRGLPGKVPFSKVITSLEELPGVTVQPNTSFTDLPLPAYVNAVLSDGRILAAPVTWAPEGSYDPTALDVPQNMVGTLTLDGIENPEELTASVSVTVMQYTVTGVLPLNDLEVPAYTRPEELNLPETVPVTLNDGRTIYMSVVWDTSSYILGKRTQTVYGNLILPDGILNPSNFRAELTIHEQTTSRSILSFEEPEPISAFYGTSFSALALPAEVVANCDNGSSVSISVTWDPTGYQQNEFGTYTLYGQLGTLPAGVKNEANLQPRIQVTVAPIAQWDAGEEPGTVTAYLYDDPERAGERIMRLSGSGRMQDRDNAPNVPWKDRREEITQVLVDGGVENIGKFAFALCTQLREVRLGHVSTVGESAFSGCSALAALEIPEQVTRIAPLAFRGTNGLTAVTFAHPASGEITVADDAFLCTSGKKPISVMGALPIVQDVEYWTANNRILTIPVTGVALDRDAASIRIGESVTLAAAVLPENATNQTILWSSSVPEVASVNGTGVVTALASGSSLITVSTEDGGFTASCTVTVLDGQKAGADITAIRYPDSETEGMYVLELMGTGSMDEYATAGKTPWYADRATISKVIVGEGITSIGKFAFNGMSNLTEVTLPEGLERIAANSFNSCARLAAITIPSTVTAVEKSAFYGCRKLTSITFLDHDGRLQLPAEGGVFPGANTATTVTIYCQNESILNYPWQTVDKRNVTFEIVE